MWFARGEDTASATANTRNTNINEGNLFSLKTLLTVDILASVVSLISLNIFSIVIAALGSVVAMVVASRLITADACDAVSRT